MLTIYELVKNIKDPRERVREKIALRYHKFLTKNRICPEYDVYDYDTMPLKFAKMLVYFELERDRILNFLQIGNTLHDYEFSKSLKYEINVLKNLKFYNADTIDRALIQKKYEKIYNAYTKQNKSLYGFIYPFNYNGTNWE